MSYDRAINTNPSAWGLPPHGARVHPDRVVVPKKVDEANTPTKFARVLREINETPYALGTQARVLTEEAVVYRIQSPTKARAHGSGLLPSLGEVLPVDAAPEQVNRIVTTRQQIQPATGRTLDLYL
jgi:hypothetical protein